MKDELLKTLEVLKKGGVILYPTDTVWGLGCDATNSRAVEQIYRIKKRSHSKSMIVLLDHFEKLYNFVENVPEIAADLVESIHTPLTIIYPGAKNLSKNLISDEGAIAIRITRDEFCMKLISMLGAPLVSTSANISGQKTPLFYHQISQEIIKQVDYSVDLSRTRIDQVKPSTIIKFTSQNEYVIVRD